MDGRNSDFHMKVEVLNLILNFLGFLVTLLEILTRT